jgi:hypothetical protein
MLGRSFLLMFYSLTTTYRPYHHLIINLSHYSWHIPLFCLNIAGMIYLSVALGCAVFELLRASSRVKKSFPVRRPEASHAGHGRSADRD